MLASARSNHVWSAPVPLDSSSHPVEEPEDLEHSETVPLFIGPSVRPTVREEWAWALLTADLRSSQTFGIDIGCRAQGREPGGTHGELSHQWLGSDRSGGAQDPP